MEAVVDNLLEAHKGEEVMAMLTGEDMRDALVDSSALVGPDPDALAGPFATSSRTRRRSSPTPSGRSC